MKKPLLILLAASAIPSGLHAANVLATWNGGNSGTYSWEQTANWSSSASSYHYPYNDGTDIYFAQIADSPGARVIETSGNLTVRGFAINQSSATGSTTLKLGGNFTATGTVTTGIPTTGFYNSTGDAARLVIDLNGHNLNFDLTEARTNLTEASNYTLRSGTGAGTISFSRLTTSATNVQIGANVTVKLNGNGQYATSSTVVWNDQSTLVYAPTGANGLGSTGSINLGNFVVGDSSSAQTTAATLRNNAFRVRGDFTVATHAGGAVSSFSFDTASRNLYVGGNFTDTGTTGNYGGATIYFNGNPGAERSVEIARTGLSTHFQVGENGDSAGNVKLDANLLTTGSFGVLGNSRLNVDTHSLTAATVRIAENAKVAFTLGADAGVIHSTGDIFLNAFVLELTYDGTGWEDGSNLLLFTYTGTLTGVPDLASIVGPGLAYDGLVYDSLNKQVYLSNVTLIPEPGTYGLLGMALLSSLLAYRKRIQ